MELTDKILKDMDDKKNISQAIFMDLSKAFDTLDNGILIKKFAHYVMNGIAQKWSPNYLTGRSQYVEIDGVSTSILSWSTGVPQGSILGLYYFLYTWMIFQTVPAFLNFILYADDTTLINTIQIPPLSTININKELAKVYDWLAVNRISLDIRKKQICDLSCHL